MQIWKKIYAWPDIEAETFEEAEVKCLSGFEVIGEKKVEINI